ncbi:MAG: hypothetical protein WC551_02735 [Patescibacteria group bacterium]
MSILIQPTKGMSEGQLLFDFFTWLADNYYLKCEKCGMCLAPDCPDDELERLWEEYIKTI